MMNNRIIRIAFVALCSFPLSFSAWTQSANNTAGIRHMVYGGLGLMMPSDQMKQQSMLKSGINFRIGYFNSFSPAQNPFQGGVEIRFDYSKFGANLKETRFSSISYDNGAGTAIPISLSLNTIKKKPDAYQYLIGPSFIWNRNQFFIGASILAGYASISQEKFDFSDSLVHASDASRNKMIKFYYAGHETNNGLVVVPGIKGGFRITSSLSLFAAADYSLGSRQDFEDFILSPVSSPVGGIYSFDALANGTIQVINRFSKFRALTLGIQLAYAF